MKEVPSPQRTAPGKVLLVSDDLETGRIWSYALRQRHWPVVLACSAEEALARWAEALFALIVIDVTTPELDGVKLCQRLRSEAVIPILVLTPQCDETHLLEVYQAGASECLAKPVSPAVFLAKTQAWLRCSWTVVAEALSPLEAGGFRLDPARHEVRTPAGAIARLTNLEFRLLYLMMSHQGKALAPDVLVDRVWGYANEGEGVLLKNVIYRLRRKVEPEPGQPRHIQTVPGAGYLFRP
jgi:two-component system response regulator RegX3